MSITEIPWAAQSAFPPLRLLIVTPLLAMIASLLARSSRQASVAGLLGAGIELALAVFILRRLAPDTGSLQFVERGSAVPVLSFHLGIDGISLSFVLLTALLTLLVVLYEEIAQERRTGLYLACLFGFEAALMGMFLSLDLMLFWLFAFLEVLPALFVLRRWSTGSDPLRAARIYGRFAGAGLLLLLCAVLLLGWSHARTTEQWSFDFLDLARSPPPESWQSPVFVLLFYGLAVRLAQFPFHAWLPIVAKDGTLVTAGVFLVGIKVGIYALVRFALPLLPSGAADWRSFAVLLGVAGTFYGAVLALMQLGLRRLLAYAAISNTGMLLVGVLSPDADGLMGTLLLSVNFGIAASGLLFATGLLHRRARTTLLPRLGAMFRAMPMPGGTFLIAALSTMAMPGTPAFDAAHLLLEGAIGANNPTIAAAVAIGNVLTAAVLLRAFRRMFLVDCRERWLRPTAGRSSRPELALTLMVCASLIGVGYYSEPWEDLMKRPVSVVTERYHPIDKGPR